MLLCSQPAWYIFIFCLLRYYLGVLGKPYVKRCIVREGIPILIRVREEKRKQEREREMANSGCVEKGKREERERERERERESEREREILRERDI